MSLPQTCRGPEILTGLLNVDGVYIVILTSKDLQHRLGCGGVPRARPVETDPTSQLDLAVSRDYQH